MYLNLSTLSDGNIWEFLKNIEHLYKSNSATLDDFLQGSADHQRGNSKRKFWGKFNFHNLT